MTRTVEFYFDFGSPAAYLAWTQLPAIAAASGAAIELRPILLGAVFKGTGNRAPIEVPAKAAWLLDDLKRFSKRYGVPFEFPPGFPVNTLTLMRLATAAKLYAPAALSPLTTTLFDAMWGRGEDLADPASLSVALSQGGLDPSLALAWSAEPRVKDALRAETDGAIGRGVFGAPTFVVEGQMHWGQDRLDFVREALLRACG